ncbi:hypothetical protein ADN00_17010 [Ornatilinea apprima]|uniref:PAC domain-containing protein n=1 Tax=Ornatilinea apprima TaxID=1134406 RepID=A0A0P6XJG7_9CHLR|nr:PAS domain S-box protein [Ornatilinea apprima]KPL71398.1 hypothetical protein ADN00_17010 [Ornatilinea apprima]
MIRPQGNPGDSSLPAPSDPPVPSADQPIHTDCQWPPEFFTQLVENLPEAVLVTSLHNGRIVYCNPKAAQMHGCTSPQELIGSPGSQWMAPDSQEKMRQFALAFGDKSPSGALQLTLRRKDGTCFPAELEVSFLSGPTGKTRCCLNVIRDITWRCRLEENLEKYRAQLLDMVERQTKDLTLANQQLQNEIEQHCRTEIALKRSEHRYRSYLESQKELIARFAENGRLVYANPAFRAFFPNVESYSLAEIQSKLIHPSQKDQIQSLFENCQPPFQTVFLANTRTPSGYRWIEWNIQSVESGHSQSVEYQCVGRDVTRQKELDEEKEELIRGLREISQHIYTI